MSQRARPPCTTVPAPDTDGSVLRRADASVLGLVIAWCEAEPERVGEVALVVGGELTLGRGSDPSPEPRVRFHRQRPFALEPRPALASLGLSRRQLLLRATERGLSVRRVGQCALEVNGAPCDEAVVLPGDTLRLRRELVLLCVERPTALPPCVEHPREAAPAFGQADESGMVGESPPAWELRERLAFAANAGTHVLLLGASGTGKELAARAVHRLSPRARGPFVSRNAATLPSGLIDAELFGNARGYPSPGIPERRGLVGEADGGTLFLDEIGELATDLQAHLLRVLDADGEHQRLGEARPRRAQLRVVAATNRPLAELKHDLVARFPTRVHLPALGERREDIPLLAGRLVVRQAEHSRVAARFVRDGRARLSASLVVHLLAREYPLHARDLEAALWEAMAASPGDILQLPPHLRAQGSARAPRGEPTADELRAALARHGGNVSQTARALGISTRFALYRLMRRLGV